MEIAHTHKGAVVVLALSGSFETVTLPTLSEHLGRLTEDGAVRICINIRDVSFISSTALGYLVETTKQLRKVDGDLVLSEATGSVAETLRMLQLHEFLPVYATDADAISHLQG